MQSAAINAPDGWIECDGRSLNKNDYSDLFSSIGYTYGGSENSFNIPDIRGRVPVGAGSGSGLTSRNLGSKGGEETHALSVTEMPSHTHSLTRRGNPESSAVDPSDAHQNESSAATTDRAELGPFDTYSTGGSAAHNIMQPFVALRYIIKY